MITQPLQSVYTVPCKNKVTQGMLYFNVIAFNFSDAVLILKDMFGPSEWIVGYGSM